MKLWVLAVYENEADAQPTRKGYAVADTFDDIIDRARDVPGKCIVLDISDHADYNPNAFPPNGIVWV